MKVAILGAGHGGVAAAAELTLAGHEVRLFQPPQFYESFTTIRETKQIEIIGEGRQGLARIEIATHNPQEALNGAEVVLVIVPAFAQEEMARLCGPYLEHGQYVFLLPGSFGTLIFARMLKQMGLEKDVILGETSTLPYGARMSSTNQVMVSIRAICNPFAAYPAAKTSEAAEVLKVLYPEISPVANVLDVALSNTNPCVHPIPTLLSAGRIEFSKGEFWLYREAITPSVWKLMRALDQERVKMREAFSLVPPHYDLPEEVGKVFLGQFGFTGLEAGQNMKGPMTLTDRYLTEDVPMGLVFFSSIAKIAGVATPIIDSVITLVSELLGIDMVSQGRTVENLGLAGLTAKELVELLG